jgi:hypothetical protein
MQSIVQIQSPTRASIGGQTVINIIPAACAEKIQPSRVKKVLISDIPVFGLKTALDLKG